MSSLTPQPISVPPQGERYRSSALESIAREAQGKKLRVLDLGRAIEQNVEFLSRFSKKIHFEDLVSGLEHHNPLALQDALEFSPGTSFDLILLWDLLNYISPEQIEELSFKLAHWSHETTKIVALINARTEMSAQPAVFRVSAAPWIGIEHLSSTLVTSPRLRKTQLKKIFPHFDRIRSCLLRNRMEEWILMPNASAEAARVVAVEVHAA